MKTKIITGILTVLFAMSILPACSQTSNTTNKPQVKINVKVNRDDKGNIISYDSSYTMTWSSNGQNSEQVDSILKNMNIDFGFSGLDPMSDSLLSSFGMNFNMNPFDFEKMMRPHTIDDSSFISIMPKDENLMKQAERMHKMMLEEMRRMQQQMYAMPNYPKNQQNSQKQHPKPKVKIEGTAL